MMNQLWLIRHGETAWSLSGAHTGRTDIPLTPNGELQALALRDKLAGRAFSRVFASPLLRARETCRIAGYADKAVFDPDLMEWNYADYEGLTTPKIRENRPDWHLWTDGAPGGESVEQVAERARRTIARATAGAGDAAIFAHGHFLRVLAACWIGLPPECGRLFALSTATISILGHERDTRVISSWNLP
jgi:probable phosphoglycerate mutase